MVEKKWYKFIFEGFTDSGARISPTPVNKYAETLAQARKEARQTFKSTKRAIKITRDEYIKN